MSQHHHVAREIARKLREKKAKKKTKEYAIPEEEIVDRLMWFIVGFFILAVFGAAGYFIVRVAQGA